jgi:hypothetical protein
MRLGTNVLVNGRFGVGSILKMGFVFSGVEYGGSGGRDYLTAKSSLNVNTAATETSIHRN